MNEIYRTTEKLPEPRTAVLVFCQNRWAIASIEWEHPTFEETFNSFLYWNVEECEIEWDDVTHWTFLPKNPGEEELSMVWKELQRQYKQRDKGAELLMEFNHNECI